MGAGGFPPLPVAKGPSIGLQTRPRRLSLPAPLTADFPPPGLLPLTPGGSGLNNTNRGGFRAPPYWRLGARGICLPPLPTYVCLPVWLCPSVHLYALFPMSLLQVLCFWQRSYISHSAARRVRQVWAFTDRSYVRYELAHVANEGNDGIPNSAPWLISGHLRGRKGLILLYELI